MKAIVTIATPQHADNKVHHFHTQTGEFDTETMKFTARRNLFGVWAGGDHDVQFSSLLQLHEAKLKAKEKPALSIIARLTAKLVSIVFTGKTKTAKL